MGSAALFHLARRGARILGLEQFSIAHELGSSHGRSRIIRLAYAEHPDYVPLLRRAYALWRELETVAGERLLVVTGGIDAGPRESATVRGCLASCAIHDLPHEVIEADALTDRFPGYRLRSDMVAVFQPDAGLLLPERCVEAHVRAARALDAQVHTGEKVTAWATDREHVAVTTTRSSYRARKLVVTAGPWARTLLPALRAPRRSGASGDAVDAAHRSGALRDRPLSCVQHGRPEGRFYGFPADETRAFKIGKYNHRRERVDDPDTMDRTCHPEDEAVLREGIRCYFPAADGPTVEMKTCLFTNSPDEHFIIDRLAGCASGYARGGVLRPRLQILQRGRGDPGGPCARRWNEARHRTFPSRSSCAARAARIVKESGAKID